VRALPVQAVRSKKGGALRERFYYKTAAKGLSKKKTIAGIARRLPEVRYAVLKNNTPYEPRPTRRIESDALQQAADERYLQKFFKELPKTDKMYEKIDC
jgi:hypothetical protein